MALAAFSWSVTKAAAVRGGGQGRLSVIRAPCVKNLEKVAGGGNGFGCVGIFEAQHVVPSIAKNEFGV